MSIRASNLDSSGAASLFPHPVSAQLPHPSHPDRAGMGVMDPGSSPPPPPIPLLAPSTGHKGVTSQGTEFLGSIDCLPLPPTQMQPRRVHTPHCHHSWHLTATPDSTGASWLLGALQTCSQHRGCTCLLLMSACAYTVPCSSERCAYSTTYLYV